MKVLTETIRSIGGKLFAALRESEKEPTIRDLAKKALTSKSSAHRQLQGIKRRNVHPEPLFWESTEGYEWIRLLFYATLLIFGVEQGIGAENLSRYFKMLRLDTHIGVSPSPIRAQLNELQDFIIRFQGEFEKYHNGTVKRVIGAADETFFGNLLILVLMDLSSGYLLLEDVSDDRSFDTWIKKAQPRLEQLGVDIEFLVSDRARALIKLAVDGFECERAADLFHAQHDISKWLGSTLGRRLGAVKKKLKKYKEKLVNAIARGAGKATKVEKVAQLDAECRTAKQNLDDYRGVMRKISKIVHPFKLTIIQGTPYLIIGISPDRLVSTRSA